MELLPLCEAASGAPQGGFTSLEGCCKPLAHEVRRERSDGVAGTPRVPAVRGSACRAARPRAMKSRRRATRSGTPIPRTRWAAQVASRVTSFTHGRAVTGSRRPRGSRPGVVLAGPGRSLNPWPLRPRSWTSRRVGTEGACRFRGRVARLRAHSAHPGARSGTVGRCRERGRPRPGDRRGGVSARWSARQGAPCPGRCGVSATPEAVPWACHGRCRRAGARGGAPVTCPGAAPHPVGASDARRPPRPGPPQRALPLRELVVRPDPAWFRRPVVEAGEHRLHRQPADGGLVR